MGAAALTAVVGVSWVHVTHNLVAMRRRKLARLG
jgi:hypothetical protein